MGLFGVVVSVSLFLTKKIWYTIKFAYRNYAEKRDLRKKKTEEEIEAEREKIRLVNGGDKGVSV